MKKPIKTLCTALFAVLAISTLASCGCLMVKEKGSTILSTVRYMIFNLVGSGLFLFIELVIE